MNAARQPKLFESRVDMWVYEEVIEGRNLTEIINAEHENVKYGDPLVASCHIVLTFVRYLKGIKLPTNVVAVPDLATAARDATLLVFVIPHQVSSLLSIFTSLHVDILLVPQGYLRYSQADCRGYR